ncbi:MAG: hypothetical protein KGI27_01355 [Thaumarchaeota archaeon]|nr:hypothetical protein [Nitrososphaerota archaeon]
MKISKLFLYDEPSVPQIKIESLAEFIKKQTGIDVEMRQCFFEHFGKKEKTFHDLASCRVFNPYVPFEKHSPTAEEVASEEQDPASNIVLYDGFELQNIFKTCIPEEELSRDQLHLIFTTKLCCSYDYEDYRYHGRTVICSNPSVISTTGIIEAPAKPRDYYLKMYEKMSQGLNLDALKNEFIGRFVEYGDDRMDRIARGYAFQAIFYHLTGSPFCESKECMLYNAHWQEDLLHAQIEIGKLCKQHQTILDNI